MKSKRAEEYIDTFRVYSDFYDGCGFIVSEGDASSAVEIAEEDMADKACRLFEQFMSGVFQGDTPKKMAEEFKQKLME